MVLTPILAAIVGLSLLFWQIWTGIDPETRSWQLFRDSLEADWEYVRMIGTVYSITGLTVGIIVAVLFSFYRRLGLAQK